MCPVLPSATLASSVRTVRVRRRSSVRGSSVAAVIGGREPIMRRRRSTACASATSTKRQSASTSRICSGVRQPASQERRRGDQDGDAAGPRDRDVQAIPRVQEAHVARRVLAARTGHRVDRDDALAALELVHRARRCRAVRAGPRRAAWISATCALYGATTMTSSTADGPRDGRRHRARSSRSSRSTVSATTCGLLARAGAIAGVLDREPSDAGPGQERRRRPRRSAAPCRGWVSSRPS